MIEKLKYLRNKNGISQQQLADVIMVSQQSVNKYENHNVEPDIDTLIKIADFFKVSVDYLIGRTENMDMASELSLSDLDREEQTIIEEYRNLSDVQKQCIKSVIKSYK